MPRAFSSGAASIWSYGLYSPKILGDRRRQATSCHGRRARSYQCSHVASYAQIYLLPSSLSLAAGPWSRFECAAISDNRPENASVFGRCLGRRIKSMPVVQGAHIGSGSAKCKRLGEGAIRPVRSGAGSGNRTRIFSLEGCCSTTELYPHSLKRSVSPCLRKERFSTFNSAHDLRRKASPRLPGQSAVRIMRHASETSSGGEGWIRTSVG